MQSAYANAKDFWDALQESIAGALCVFYLEIVCINYHAGRVKTWEEQ